MNCLFSDFLLSAFVDSSALFTLSGTHNAFAEINDAAKTEASS